MFIPNFLLLPYFLCILYTDFSYLFICFFLLSLPSSIIALIYPHLHLNLLFSSPFSLFIMIILTKKEILSTKQRAFYLHQAIVYRYTKLIPVIFQLIVNQKNQFCMYNIYLILTLNN